LIPRAGHGDIGPNIVGGKRQRRDFVEDSSECNMQWLSYPAGDWPVMQFIERSRIASKIFLTVAPPALSIAMLAGAAEARDWKTEAASGQQIRAHGYCAGKNQKTCVESALPRIEITVPPKNGTIAFGNNTSTDVFNRVGEVRVGKEACPKVPVHCVQILYTSKDGYQGSDQFSYTVHVADGQKWHDTIAVDVHGQGGAASGGAQPPSAPAQSDPAQRDQPQAAPAQPEPAQ
jgi:hypothetical protein